MKFPEQVEVGDTKSKFDRLLSIPRAHSQGARGLKVHFSLDGSEISKGDGALRN